MDCSRFTPTRNGSNGDHDSEHNPWLHHEVYQPCCAQYHRHRMDFCTSHDWYECVQVFYVKFMSIDYADVIFHSTVAFIAQGLYCYRIGMLTRSTWSVILITMVRTFWLVKNANLELWLTALYWKLSLAQLVASITLSIQIERAALVSRLLSQKSSLETIAVSTSVLRSGVI